MPIPDENFRDLLVEYVADTPDDGFSDHVMKTVNQRESSSPQLKKRAVYGAMFIGGLISGSQFPALLSLMDGQSTRFDMATSSGYISLSIAFAFVLGICLLLAEQREFSL